MTTLIPPGLQRRLVLAWLGARYLDGAWWLGHQRLSEEHLDAMPARAWQRFVRRCRTQRRR